MKSVAAGAAADGALTTPRVLTLLAVIFVLAFVLPYSAVYALHVRRLNAADATARAIADRLSDALRAGTSEMPAATQVLAGPGDQPRALDERWSAIVTFPLARVLKGSAAIPVDPWGNAYLAKVGSRPGSPVWVISAGPDGILQTPLASSGDVASGDDRIARIK